MATCAASERVESASSRCFTSDFTHPRKSRQSLGRPDAHYRRRRRPTHSELDGRTTIEQERSVAKTLRGREDGLDAPKTTLSAFTDVGDRVHRRR